MQNFNTNQTRHFYVVGAVDSSVDTNLDIAMKQTETGEIFFSYKNADGLLTRTDTIDPKKIVSLRKATAAQMAKPILAHKVTVAADFTPGSGYIGKTISCMVTVHQMFDYDDANCLTYTASIVANSTNMTSAATFYRAMAAEIFKVVPTDLVKVYLGSTEVTKDADLSNVSASAIYLIPKIQKYVRGKLPAETATLSVAFRLHDGDDTVWGDDKVDTVANINTADTLSLTPDVIPAVYTIADLEYFALGERGDYYRGFNYPLNYETTYAINLSSSYDMLSIEYYWSGDAENVQKSPRLMEFAGSNSDIAALYDLVDAARNGVASS